MTKEQFLNIKIKPLEWDDTNPNNFDVVGHMLRTQAIVDTWDDEAWNKDDGKRGPRIYHRFDIFTDNADNMFAASVSLEKKAIPVKSFEEGKAVCERWHQEYWHEFFKNLADTVVSFN